MMESINVVIDDLEVPTNFSFDEESNAGGRPKMNESKDSEKVTLVEKDRGEQSLTEQEVTLEPSSRVKLNHPVDQVIGSVTEPMKTRRQVRNEVNYLCYTSTFESKNVKETLNGEHGINAMHDELSQFE